MNEDVKNYLLEMEWYKLATRYAVNSTYKAKKTIHDSYGSTYNITP